MPIIGLGLARARLSKVAARLARVCAAYHCCYATTHDSHLLSAQFCRGQEKSDPRGRFFYTGALTVGERTLRHFMPYRRELPPVERHRLGPPQLAGRACTGIIGCGYLHQPREEPSSSSFGELLLGPPLVGRMKHAAMSARAKIIAQPFGVGVRIGERDVAVGPDEIECRAP